jgi:uncharacterized protein YraI
MLRRRGWMLATVLCGALLVMPTAPTWAGQGRQAGHHGRSSELTRHHMHAAPKARAAVTGYRVYGTGGYGLIERSGPGTGYARVGSLAEGTWLDITCQVRSGSSVGGSTMWDLLSNGGWISDYYTTTPVYNDNSPGIPICGSREQRGVAWARAQLGQSYQSDGKPWNGWCDRFVANAFGMANSGYYTAYDHWLNLANRGLVVRGDTNVPYGALAFYYNGNGGHVMISEGNGLFVSTGPSVYETGLTSYFGSYLGWAWANPEWPGR